MWKRISAAVRVMDRVFSTAILIPILLLVLLTVYMIQINRIIISDASNEQYQIYKPTEDDPLSLEKLRDQNPETIGWLFIEGTDMDYPLVQTDNNVKYVNTSVFGEFSLTGALFLDFRNNSDFSDILSVIYGHNMVDNVMFGGIVLYEDEDYFNSHTNGTLYSNGDYYRLRIYAYFRADSYDTTVFNPDLTDEEFPEWKNLVTGKAIHLSGDFPDGGQTLMLSTCSAGDTNGRNILLAEILPGGKPFEKQESAPVKKSVSFVGYYLENERSWLLIPAGATLIVLTGLFIFFAVRRKRKAEGQKEPDNETHDTQQKARIRKWKKKT